MSTQKEERERLRQERLAAQQSASSSERRRLILGYIVAGILVAAIVAGIVVAITGGGESDTPPGVEGEVPEAAHWQPQIGSIFEGAEPDGREGSELPPLGDGDLTRSAEAAGCDLQLDLPVDGANHFTDEDREVESKTSPPASGDHYGVPTETGSGALADGAYLNQPPMSRAVHALEHGRIEIQYSPDLPEEDQLVLKGIFDESPEGMIMFPNPDMPYDVAAVGWTQLIGCDDFDPDTAVDAIRNFRDIHRGNGPENFPLVVSG